MAGRRPVRRRSASVEKRDVGGSSPRDSALIDSVAVAASASGAPAAAAPGSASTDHITPPVFELAGSSTTSSLLSPGLSRHTVSLSLHTFVLSTPYPPKCHLKFHLFQSAFTILLSCASASDSFSRFLALCKLVCGGMYACMY